jgi:Ca2+:H+ antiporter
MIFFFSRAFDHTNCKLIGEATENLAHYTGDAIGGLLNATFGNAPELIISVIALNAGLYDMVLASLLVLYSQIYYWQQAWHFSLAV